MQAPLADIVVNETTIIEKYIEKNFNSSQQKFCKDTIKHIDDKVLEGYELEEIKLLGWGVPTKMYILSSIKEYADTLSFKNGWLEDPVKDLIKLDDSWLKLAQQMHDTH